MNKLLLAAAGLLICAGMMAQAPKTTEIQMNKPAKQLVIDTTATGPVYEIKTDLGSIKVRLYDDTPLHRDNFAKLADAGEYDSVLFHRVIKDFMVQTGDLNSKNPDNKIPLGAGDNGYTVPAEISYPAHFHKYGALAAARTGDEVNPERASSGSQFYIVTGNVWNPSSLARMAENSTNKERQAYFQKLVRENWPEIQKLQQANDSVALDRMRDEMIAKTESAVKPAAMPDNVAAVYTTIGGTPHLDGAYTVFGEVLDGMDVVEKIQASQTDRQDNPVTPIRIISVRRVEK